MDPNFPCLFCRTHRATHLLYLEPARIPICSYCASKQASTANVLPLPVRVGNERDVVKNERESKGIGGKVGEIIEKTEGSITESEGNTDKVSTIHWPQAAPHLPDALRKLHIDAIHRYQHQNQNETKGNEKKSIQDSLQGVVTDQSFSQELSPTDIAALAICIGCVVLPLAFGALVQLLVLKIVSYLLGFILALLIRKNKITG